MKAKVLFALPVLALLISCSDDLSNFQKQYNNVDPELWTHYAEFEFQAEKRGLSYGLNNLNVTGEISEIHESGVAGSCQYGSAIDNHVTIDETFWSRSNNLNREFVVFHELGHCALFRNHDERQNAQGLCLSLMRSGTGTCRDAYSVENRDAYLDELFAGKD